MTKEKRTMAEELKMPLQRFKFIKNPSRGVFLDIAIGTSSDDNAPALKILKGIMEQLEQEPSKIPGVPKSVTEDVICYAIELELPALSDGGFPVIMQDGRLIRMQKKPDGTYETFEEAVEREWPAAEIRRAAQGGV